MYSTLETAEREMNQYDSSERKRATEAHRGYRRERRRLVFVRASRRTPSMMLMMMMTQRELADGGIVSSLTYSIEHALIQLIYLPVDRQRMKMKTATHAALCCFVVMSVTTTTTTTREHCLSESSVCLQNGRARAIMTQVSGVRVSTGLRSCTRACVCAKFHDMRAS